jgi:methyltransferase (TIGR00027 family)
MAAARARETKSANRLFEDPFAEALAGDEGFAMADRSVQGSPNGADPYVCIRTRFLDDALSNAVTESPCKQVVILAAGMDTRAFRLPWASDVTIYELDRAEMFEQKEPTLRRLVAKTPATRKVVHADLEKDWPVPLLRAGFDTRQPAAFLLEGLLVYIPESAVEALFANLAKVAMNGSWLGLDVPGRSLLESPYMTAYLELMKTLGCPWVFGMSEPEMFMARHGWQAKVVCPGEPEANYGRWPYPVAPRSMPGIPRSYLITARKRS